MPNFKFLMILGFSISIALTGCKKETVSPTTNNPNNPGNPGNPSNPSSGPYASLLKAFEAAAPKSTTMTINAAIGASFFGATGTRYVFPPNAFQTAGGAIVSGPVAVEVQEYLTEDDMIFGKMLTMSGGMPLISAGEVRVAATQGGNALFIRPGMNYIVYVPNVKSSATADMSFFSGFPSTSSPFNMVDWRLVSVDSLKQRVVYKGDTILMLPDNLGLSNLDKFATTDFSTVDITLSGAGTGFAKEDVMIYSIFEGLLGAVIISDGTFSGAVYTGAKMVNLKSHIVVCCVSGDDFYAGTLNSITSFFRW